MLNFIKVESGLTYDELSSIMQEKEEEAGKASLFWGEEIHFSIGGKDTVCRFLYCDEEYEPLDNIIYTKKGKKYDVYVARDTTNLLKRRSK